jgi:hypothetical protein
LRPFGRCPDRRTGVSHPTGKALESLKGRAFAAEDPLAERFETEVADELAALDDACAVLLFVLQERGRRSVEIPLEDGEEPPDDLEEQLASSHYTAFLRRAASLWSFQAQTLIGAKALRQIQAARAVLRVGYEWEVSHFVRVIVELIEHRDAVQNDATGEQAWYWLKGTRKAKNVKIAEETRELYENLSRDSHGDVATITRLFDAEDGAFELAPRRTHRTRATLLMLAGFARNQASVVAAASGNMGIRGLEALDDHIASCWARLTEESMDSGS